jgi:RNA polymerase sigma-70 factor (ECF subfamily)
VERTEDFLLSAIRKLREGPDEDSSRFLLERFRSRLQGYFRHHRFRDEDAEDLVQETFRRVFRGIGGLEDEARFLGWLFQIANNVRITAQVASHQRDQYRAELPDTFDNDFPGRQPDPLRIAIAADRLDRTWKVIEVLPGQQRQCLLMFVLQEMSYDEIAVVLQLSVNTVRNHIREARITLKRLLAEEPSEEK